MKFHFKQFVLLLALLLLPLPVLAHGGVTNFSGNVTVYLKQSPISPLVGENVQMAFVIKDSKGQALANKPVELKLIDTYFGDESKDSTILTLGLTTDTNGNLIFDYTFSKENYFDVELTMADPVTLQPQTVGFLVQPREIRPHLLFATFGILGIVIGLLLSRVIKRPAKPVQP